MSYTTELQQDYAARRQRLMGTVPPETTRRHVIHRIVRQPAQPAETTQRKSRRSYPLDIAFEPVPRGPFAPAIILRQVCTRWGVTRADLTGPLRERQQISPARAEACWRLFHEAELTMNRIGTILHKDHTSVRTALLKYAERHGLELVLIPPDVRRDRSWTPWRIAKAVQMHSEGYSFRAIGRALDTYGLDVKKQIEKARQRYLAEMDEDERRAYFARRASEGARRTLGAANG